MDTPLFCADHGCFLPPSLFHPSSKASRVNYCKEHLNERRRTRYRKDPEAALVLESRKLTGVSSLSRQTFDTIVSAHLGRCFISGSTNRLLVLLRTVEYPFSHETEVERFVPVLRKYAHAPCLWEPHLSRHRKWLAVRSLKEFERRSNNTKSEGAVKPAPTAAAAPTQTPGGAGLVLKGRSTYTPTADERWLLKKAVELGIDATSFWHSLILAQQRMEGARRNV
jgi:hypothetical protein